jgi:hypothetical protein
MPNPILANYTSANLIDLISSPQNCEEPDMATKFRDFKVSEYWNLAWPFTVVAAVGIAFHLLARWCSRHILGVFGDALIVTGVLGLTLELFAVRFLIERVALDVAEKLAGRGLPSALQTLIHDLVGTRIVRENYVKSYRFSDPDSDGNVSVDVTIRFIARNYSGSTVQYPPSIQEETFYSPEFKYMEYGTATSPATVLREEQILKLTTVDPYTHVKSMFAPPIDLPSVHADSNARCDVLLKYGLKMREEYSDVTSFGGATLGATLEIDYIPDALEFVSGGDDKVRHAPDSRTWYFDRPFINGQHIRAWWFRKSRHV